MDNIEVYKQSQRFATQLQVRKDLSLMDRGDRVHGLEFNNDEVLDEQIDPVSEVQPYAIVVNRQTDLSFRSKTRLFQFVLKASEVGVFKQTWPQVCMNSHRGRDDCMADLLRCERCGGSSCHKTLTTKDTKVAQRHHSKPFDNINHTPLSVMPVFDSVSLVLPSCP